MRKVILSIMAVAAISFTSCGNKTENGGDVDSTANEMEVSVLPDWTNAESAVKSLDASLEIGTPEDVEDCVEKMEAQVAKLVEQGKLDEAKAYAEKIQNFVKANKEKLAATGSALVSSFVETTEKMNLDNLEATAKDWASVVKSAAEGSGQQVVSDVEGAVKDAAGDVAGKAEEVKDKAQAAKQAAEDEAAKLKAKADEARAKAADAKAKVENAPQQAKEAAQQAVDKAKQDAKNKVNEEVNKGLNKVFGK